MVIPQYVVLQIGSLLYRLDNPGDDIIRWPNYFSINGVDHYFRIPKKTERMCPSAAFQSEFPSAGKEGQSKKGRRSARKDNYQWNVSTDVNNQLHFLSGVGEGGIPSKWPDASENVYYEKIPAALLNLPQHIIGLITSLLNDIKTLLTSFLTSQFYLFIILNRIFQKYL